MRIRLLHGLGAEPDDWDAVRRLVPEADAPRLPDALEDAIADAAEWLAAGPGVLVGHSMGGHVALAAALRSGRDHHRLLLVAPGGLGPPPPPQVLAMYEAPVLLARSRVDFENATRVLFADPHGVHANAYAARRSEIVGTAAHGRWARRTATQVEGVARTWPGPAALDVPCPMELLWGAADRFVPRAPLDAFAAAHPRCTLTVVPGAGHMLPVEQPAVVERAIRAAIRR
jgi:pimeloyl-ACP methyl ester carboxylesterase